LIEDLRGARENNQLRICYQPIIELDTGRMSMAEALVRWEHPVRGMIGPEEFIYLAEEAGLMVEIGDWVFREAAQQAKGIRERHDPNFQISVNQSIAQFRKNSTLYRTWLDYLEELNLPGDAIVIEIMESMMMDADSLVSEKLAAFRNAGIQISLDDFGTGLSSVSYLKRFDINYVKIDQPFVRDLTSSPDAMAVCEAIIVMAHKLGLKVIAEGVETTKQKSCLHEVGCDYAQGFLFSVPVPLHELDKLLNKAKEQRQQHENLTYSAHERSLPNPMPPVAMSDGTASKQRKNQADISRHDN
jgi:EAL domain-containing protein (putative c-di-GMP-specific phosphodiesterase class I)